MAIVDTDSVSIADLWRLLTPTIGVNNLGLTFKASGTGSVKKVLMRAITETYADVIRSSKYGAWVTTPCGRGYNNLYIIDNILTAQYSRGQNLVHKQEMKAYCAVLQIPRRYRPRMDDGRRH